ncbi:type II secretion system protein [Desulfobacula sp.]|uniref:type II secretion system protein n=1 Tax=Desulfobacula sp. TaxID=2593537 RepID=UPI00260FB312|nr:type II secretion system protein [Desulfobacula sp.]
MKNCMFGTLCIWKQKGFTLIEILIVVMVLGILAMIIVPQITVSTQDAKESTLATNISALRNAIELYYLQHNNVYPGGTKNTGAALGNADDSALAFVEQLTQYTDATGKVAVAYNATTAPFGPYLKGGSLPTNPFNDKNDVVCNITETSILVKTATSATGWLFYVKTGNLIANDGAHTNL